MNFSSQQIESIIQSVMRELMSRGVHVGTKYPISGAGDAAPRSLATTADVSATDQPATAGPTDALVISGKVITEDSLASAHAAGRAVQFQAGAIVTPSGHDFIRRHQVILAGTAPAATGITSTGIVVSQSCHAAASAADTAGWQLITAGCERDAARVSVQHFDHAAAQGSLPVRIVCCVDVPAATACLLNRRDSLRAAVLDPAAESKTLLSLMNPHVLCLESSRWSFTALLRLLKQLSRVSLTTPADWKEV